MISPSKAAQFLGQQVCIHWTEPDGREGGMSGEGWKLEDDHEDKSPGARWFIVDYGYGIQLRDVKAMHLEAECPDRVMGTVGE